MVYWITQSNNLVYIADKSMHTILFNR